MAGGRLAGPLRGETPQAAELALWLKSLTRGLTLRDLEERFPYRRTQWGEFRSGAKLIPSWLLDDLVRALVPEPRLQAQMLAKGQKLLADAEQAAAGKLMPAPSSPGPGAASPGELQIRLDDARRGQMQAERAMLGLTQIIVNLLAMIASLQDRCRALEAEQERLRAAGPPDAEAAVQEELSKTRRVMDQAQAQREQAQTEREQAEEIRISARLLEVQHQRDLQQLARGAAPEPDPHGEEEPELAAGLPGLDLVPLYEYDVVLERQDTQLAATGRVLEEVREDLDLPVQVPGEGPTVVRGQVLDAAAQPVPAKALVDSPQEEEQEGGLSAGDEADTPGEPAPSGGSVPVPPGKLEGDSRRRSCLELAVIVGVPVVILAFVVVSMLAVYNYFGGDRTRDPVASSSTKPTHASTGPTSKTATPDTATPSSTAPAKAVRLPAGTSVPRCTSSAVKISLSASRNAYAPGQDPVFVVQAENSTSTSCALDMSPSHAVFTVASAAHPEAVYFSGAHCPLDPTFYLVPAHGEMRYTATWRKGGDIGDCGFSAEPVPYDNLFIKLTIRGYPPRKVSFVLLPPATATATPA